MFQSTKDAVATVQQTLFYLSEVIEVARAINSQISRSKITSSTLYAKAMSGKLNDSPIVRELLLAVKKTPSDILTHVIQTIEGLMPEPHASDLWMLAERLHELIAEDDSGQPMRSEHDVRHDTMRTTVVAQKVQLSRHKTKLSEKDEAYSKIVTEFHELLTAMFKDIQNPLDLLGHEIVIYDFRMPHRAAVTPKPRFALERALSSPHDYLNCQCCGAAANGGIQGDVSFCYAINSSKLANSIIGNLNVDNPPTNSSTLPLISRIGSSNQRERSLVSLHRDHGRRWRG
jgi:origin recognition complex subunit 3